MNALVKVPFYGDTIEAVRDLDGKILVSLKRVCEALGVDVESQRRKLRDRKWCAIIDKTAQAKGVQGRRLTFIDHESLPLWLVTINANNLYPEIREKLERYQCEAKAVLSAWFLGTSSDFPALAKDFADIKFRFNQLAAKHDTLSGVVGVHKQASLRLRVENKSQASRFGSVMQPFVSDYCEYMTIREYCKKYEVLGETGNPLTRGEMIWAGRSVSGMSAVLG